MINTVTDWLNDQNNLHAYATLLEINLFYNKIDILCLSLAIQAFINEQKILTSAFKYL